jgi:hypothetical protein
VEARAPTLGPDMPVELIVPEAIASKAGRRAARLGGDHGKNTARKSPVSREHWLTAHR